MYRVRRFLAVLTAPLIASVPAAYAEFAAAGQLPSSLGDLLPVLLFVSRFAFAASLGFGFPVGLVLRRHHRFSFWPMLALGATLGLMVALAVHIWVVPRTFGWALVCCILPGAVGGACFWWIGGWTASLPPPEDVGKESGPGFPDAARWRRRVLVTLAIVAASLAAALVIPRPDLRGVSSAELQRRTRLRPRSRVDLFSGRQWEAAAAREPFPGLEDMARVFDRYLPNGTGIIPLDEKLLTRVTFVGMSVREVRELLGPPRNETNQPFGTLQYGMWPMVRDCAQPLLNLRFEPDENLEPRIVAEVIERRLVLCRS